MKRTILLLTISLISFLAFSDETEITQTVRGRVMDKQSAYPLPGANIILLGSDPIVGTTSGPNGYFTLENVPTGRVSIEVSYLGYLTTTLSNLNLSSGKEIVLDVTLEEKIFTSEEVVIRASQDKTRPLNEMATVSARTFSVEESQRYAGARNDVARMAANYAGVGALNDAVNDIVIRGNSPNGLLWRLEGIPIPNPNHFGQLGATGGPVNMLNNNTLANSDFMTGAFPGEYGNATSGVFDLSLRNGNYDNHEFLGQIGFNGFEFGAEGPISRKNNSSYLVNYRYSTLSVMSALGIDFGTGTSIPNYQDISFKVNIPLKNSGRIEVFGLGGLNNITFVSSTLDSTETDENLYATENLDVNSDGKMGVAGINYTQHLNSSTFIKLGLAATYFDNSQIVDTVLKESNAVRPLNRQSYEKSDFILSGSIHKKFNSRNYLKAGFMVDRIGLNMTDSTYLEEYDGFRTLVDAQGNTYLINLYTEWQHRFNQKLELNLGLHAQSLTLNGSFALEPRAGVKWRFSPGQSLSLGYGLHSRTQLPEIYFKKYDMGNGAFQTINEDVDFTRSHHIVAGYDVNLAQNLRLKAETYYQYLFNVPVERESSNFSMINLSGIQTFQYDSLENTGIGRNYGLELTVEKFLSNGFYFLATGSLFDSKYKGSDGILRSSAFDSRYVANFLGGKEFQLNKNKPDARFKTWLVFDGKVTTAGGLRYTPVDVEKSREYGYTVYQEDQAFAKQFSDYFRLDLKVSFRMDSRRISQELSLDVQNVTNRKNPLFMRYDTTTGQEEFVYQLGLFPVVQYRITF